MEIIGVREEGVPAGAVETHADNFPDYRKDLAPNRRTRNRVMTNWVLSGVKRGAAFYLEIYTTPSLTFHASATYSVS